MILGINKFKLYAGRRECRRNPTHTHRKYSSNTKKNYLLYKKRVRVWKILYPNASATFAAIRSIL